jgi:hypothetical protein
MKALHTSIILITLLAVGWSTKICEATDWAQNQDLCIKSKNGVHLLASKHIAYIGLH